MTDYWFYGHTLRSEIPLPTLRPAQLAETLPDIVLRLGGVPCHLQRPIWTSPFLEIAGNGEVLAKIGQRLRFHITGGREIVLQREAGRDTGEVETYLSSLVAGVLLHQRGDFALHASCVAIGGCAVALSGVSGCGKSTLASALALEGHTLVSDDVCRVRFTDRGPMAVPGPPRLRLWPDTVRLLALGPEDVAHTQNAHPKRLLTDIACAADCRPLRALVRLKVDRRVNRPFIEPLTGPSSVMPIDDLVYRTRLGRTMGRGANIFTDLMRLGGLVKVFRLVRPEKHPDPRELAGLVALTLVPNA